MCTSNGYRNIHSFDLYVTTGTTLTGRTRPSGRLGYTFEIGFRTSTRLQAGSDGRCTTTASTGRAFILLGETARFQQVRYEDVPVIDKSDAGQHRRTDDVQDVEYATHAVIAGRVVDADGQPVEADLVAARTTYIPLGPGGGNEPFEETSRALSGSAADGTFAWHLPPSTTPIAAEDDAREAWELSISTEDGRTATRRVFVDRGETADLGDIVARPPPPGRRPRRPRRPGGPPRAGDQRDRRRLHTNLGRAPLSDRRPRGARGRGGACDVEYDLASGVRGSRGARLEPLLAEATGAEAGHRGEQRRGGARARPRRARAGRPVLVSRGELVEIGGSFRLPEIMAASGARLVEVGTTNKTRPADYAARGEDVALILKVHPSNYRITGFTEEAAVSELAAVARSAACRSSTTWARGCCRPRRALAARRAEHRRVARRRRRPRALQRRQAPRRAAGGAPRRARRPRRRVPGHPLARALRLDKLRIAALVATSRRTCATT
jgi:hypothetical protein